MPQNPLTSLNHLQLGRYGEYYAKMEFTKAGFDVYTAEVDDKGIDFVIRKNENEYFDIQVKSIRNCNYVFMKKEVFKPRKNLHLALVLIEEKRDPTILLIPSLEWKNKTHPFLVERNYENKKTKPEWGISISRANIDKIKQTYDFSKQVKQI